MELQYRGAMIGGIVCQMFFGIILVALYRALYNSKPQTLPIESVGIRPHTSLYTSAKGSSFRVLSLLCCDCVFLPYKQCSQIEKSEKLKLGT